MIHYLRRHRRAVLRWLRCVRGRFPVITGVSFGQQQAKIQFPIGCRVELDLRGQRPVLRYVEDLVVATGK